MDIIDFKLYRQVDLCDLSNIAVSQVPFFHHASPAFLSEAASAV
jgi:hypothetical protein